MCALWLCWHNDWIATKQHEHNDKTDQFPYVVMTTSLWCYVPVNTCENNMGIKTHNKELIRAAQELSNRVRHHAAATVAKQAGIHLCGRWDQEGLIPFTWNYILDHLWQGCGIALCSQSFSPRVEQLVLFYFLAIKSLSFTSQISDIQAMDLQSLDEVRKSIVFYANIQIYPFIKNWIVG